MLRQLVAILLASLMCACTGSGCVPAVEQLKTIHSIPGYTAGIVISTGRSIGSACVVGPDRAYTVAHVVKDAKVVEWKGKTLSGGVAQIVWIDPTKDLAIIQAEEPGFETIPLRPAKRAPELGEELIVIGLMQDKPAIWYVRAISIDPEGRLLLDGMSFPGTSGGCIVNQEGELVALLQGSEILINIPSQRSWLTALPMWKQS